MFSWDENTGQTLDRGCGDGGGGGYIPHMALKHFYNSPARAGWWVRGESVPTCLTCHHMNSEPDKQNEFFLYIYLHVHKQEEMINHINYTCCWQSKSIWPLAWLHTACVYQLGYELPNSQSKYPSRTETITGTIRWQRTNLYFKTWLWWYFNQTAARQIKHV